MSLLDFGTVAAGLEPPPAELVDYFEHHRMPAGQSWQDVLARFDHAMNAVGLSLPSSREVVIHERDGWRLRAAVWRPEQAGNNRPVVLHLHGGAWAAGNHLSFAGVAAILTNGGYVVVSLDYRRAPRHQFPAAYDDAVAALNWCRASIAEFGGDPANIVVLGESAGSNLAAAVLVDDEARVARSGVLLYGLYEFASAAAVMSELGLPTSYVPAERVADLVGDRRLNPILGADRLPPCLVLVGTDDWAVDQSRRLWDAIERGGNGAASRYGELEDTPHGFSLLPGHPGFRAGWEWVLAYLADVTSDPTSGHAHGALA